MGYDDWDKAIRNGTVADDIREARRKTGLDPDVKPTHRWLNQNGFSAIQNYAHRNEKTVDEVLLEDLGFVEASFDYDISHDQTEQLVRNFFADHQEEWNEWNENTITPNQSGMKKIAACSRAVFGTDNLLRPVTESSEVAREMFKRLCSQLEDEVGEGACRNYARTLNEFYAYLAGIEYIDENKFATVFDKKNYQAKREAPQEADVPSAEDVRTLFMNADDIMKTALLLLGGAGDRPQQVPTRTTADLDLDRTDPRIYSGSDNKTGPSSNALMAGREYLQKICQLRSQNQDGENVYLLPSEDGKDPHLTYRTLLRMVKDHAREYGVTKHDGDPITLKSLKQFYLNEQAAADIEFKSTVARRVTDAVGDQRAGVKDDHYIVNQINRDHFRQYAEAKFAVAFPNHVITIEELREARAQRNRDVRQTGLDDFV
ncbi:hypothetical protein ACOJIV_07565 [Haloarcula sp. AONF1]